MILECLKQLKLHPFISDRISIESYQYPFNHIIIKNLLKDDIYNSLCENFESYIIKTKKFGKIGDTNLFYDAKIYEMKEEDCKNGYEFFVSLFWQSCISFLFQKQFNQHIAYTLHEHEPNTKDGYPHLDLSICSVIEDHNKQIKLTGDCLYADDSKLRQPYTKKIVRSVAGLYYFNNKTNGNDDLGGGTAIYNDYNTQNINKIIPPINNSMFLFEIGSKSFHGFKKSKFKRSAIVQWFHEDLSIFIKNHKEELDNIKNETGNSFERWLPNEELCDLI